MLTIGRPIEQRNTAKGKPDAILHYAKPLNNRQARLLAALPNFDSRVVLNKKDVNMRDLAALTAETGDEYALFTRKNKRLVIRGDAARTNVTVEDAQRLAAEGYKWSGHTHPGEGVNVLLASDGDMEVLRQFHQSFSAIWDWHGNFNIFDRGD